MSRFDAREGEEYGVCVDCGVALATEDDARQHRIDTMPEGGRSHRTRGTNPTRAQRIQSFVDGVVENAIQQALDEVRSCINRGDLTADEATEALNWHSAFADAWDREADE